MTIFNSYVSLPEGTHLRPQVPKYDLSLTFGSKLIRPATSDAPRGREAYRDPTRQSIVGAAMFQPARMDLCYFKGEIILYNCYPLVY